MDEVAEQRVLLGVDVVASASRPGYELHRLSQAWQAVLTTSLWQAGIGRSDVVEWEQTGDGALLTLPQAMLGRVVDMSQGLHQQVAAHNRVNKLEIRLRMAVDVGPVPDHPSYLRAKINRARLLDAKVFKDTLNRCIEEDRDAAHTGLIVSDHAFRTVFGGDYTAAVRESEFTEVMVSAKEYQGSAWLRIPGFDTRSVRGFSESVGADTTDPAVDEVPVASVHNHVTGHHNGVQAGTIHGGLTFEAIQR